MTPLHESAEATAAANAERVVYVCGAEHPRRGSVVCERTAGHLKNLRVDGYLAWHEGRDTAGNTYRWR